MRHTIYRLGNVISVIINTTSAHAKRVLIPTAKASGVIFHFSVNAVPNPPPNADNLCNSAFQTVPFIGTPTLIFSLIIFSFTTLISWSYYGEKAIQFLVGDRWIKPWRIFYIFICAVGGGLGTAFTWSWTISPDAFEVGLSTRFAWALAVLMMTFMTLPNLYMLWRIRHKLVSETKRHLAKEIQ